MALDRESEIYSLLAEDRNGRGHLSKTGEVAGYMRDHLTLEEMRQKMGNSTPPTNRIKFVEYLIVGGTPSARWIAEGVLPIMTRWLKGDLLSPELRSELMIDQRLCADALDLP
jgi:hypothetical protein